MIEHLSDKHLDAVEAIQAASYSEGSREDIRTLKYHWTLFPELCLVGFHHLRPAGYLIAHPWPLRVPPPINEQTYTVPENANSIFIHDLALLPESRSTGLATRLVETLLTTGLDSGYSFFSLISVQGTRKFWAKFGFQEVLDLPQDYFEVISDFYPNGGYFYMEKS